MQRMRVIQRDTDADGVTRSIGAPASTAVELAQLRIRVIALENLVIALLAQTSARQLEMARQMATYISPRPGFTHHRPTVHAAAQMVHMVQRADHFRDDAPPPS